MTKPMNPPSKLEGRVLERARPSNETTIPKTIPMTALVTSSSTMTLMITKRKMTRRRKKKVQPVAGSLTDSAKVESGTLSLIPMTS